MNKYDIAGWYGVVVALSMYVLIIFEILTPRHPTYLILNITAGIGIALDTWKRKDYQPLTLNIIWVAITLIPLLHLAFRYHAA